MVMLEERYKRRGHIYNTILNAVAYDRISARISEITRMTYKTIVKIAPSSKLYKNINIY